MEIDVPRLKIVIRLRLAHRRAETGSV